jgi:hypothetical protein
LSRLFFSVQQIHLYSDGGIDISRDGRYFITCARVYVPGFPLNGRDGSALRTLPAPPRSRNFPPIKPGAGASDRERRGDRPYPPSADDEDTWLSRLSSLTGGVRSNGSYPQVSPPGTATWGPAVPPQEVPATLYIAHNMRNIATGSVSNTGSNSPVVKKPSPAVSASTSPLLGSASANNSHSETGKSSSAAQMRDNSYPDLPEMIASMSLTDSKTIDGIPVVTDVTRGRIKLKTHGVATAGTADGSADRASSAVEAVRSSGDCEPGSRPVWPREQLRSASQDGVVHSVEHEHLRLADRPPQGNTRRAGL